MKNWKNSESNTPEPPLQGGDYFLPPPLDKFLQATMVEVWTEAWGEGREKYWGPPENVVAQGPP